MVCFSVLLSFLIATVSALDLHHFRSGVRERMEYWKDNDKVQKPLVPEGDRYLLFNWDHGGLNNIRIGWEMAALAAKHTNRVLVYPPEENMYLVGNEPSGFDYWLNMDRVRSGMPIMSLAEFVHKEGEKLGASKGLQAWAANPKTAKFPRQDWFQLRRDTMTNAGHDDDSVCDMKTYETDAKIVYTDPADGGRIFSCGNWPNVGEPRFHVRKNGRYAGRWDAPASSFAMLRNHFMWHPDAFDIASRVVEHLGLFKYVSVHARYGDFQFQNHRKVQDTLLKDGWLSEARSFLQVDSGPSVEESSLLESGMSSVSRAKLATSRGQRVVGLVRRWLEEDKDRKVYIATDETSAEFKKPFVDANIKLVKWSELLEQGRNGEGPLKDVMGSYSKERLTNLAGPIEQLICTFGKVFIGSEKSTFTGYIERMRLYAQAPTHATYIKYAGEAASDTGLRMFHDRSINPEVEQKVSELIEMWDKNDGKLDRSDAGILPLDAA